MEITKKDMEEFLEKLKQESKKKVIIVEGPNDKKSLELFKIKNVVVLRKPLYLVVEHIVNTEKDCIILTDLDKKGKELHGKLTEGLSQHGVMIDNKPREFLFKTKLRQIEGLTNYMRKLQ